MCLAQMNNIIPWATNRKEGGESALDFLICRLIKLFLYYSKTSNFSPFLLWPALSSSLTVGTLVKTAAVSGKGNRGSQLEKKHCMKTKGPHCSHLFAKPPFLNSYSAPAKYSLPGPLLQAGFFSCVVPQVPLAPGTSSRPLPPDLGFPPSPALDGI